MSRSSSLLRASMITIRTAAGMYVVFRFDVADIYVIFLQNFRGTDRRRLFI